MSSRWGSALAAACAGLLALIHAPARAQVEWVTSLSSPLAPVSLTQQTAAGASDGSTYLFGVANDGETTRVRLSRISASGVVQWVRWANGGFSSSALLVPLIVHPDNSATVLHQDSGNSSNTCVENFSSSGVSRFVQCFYSYSNLNVRLAADGDLYVVTDYQRVVRKISPAGVLRWQQSDSSSYSSNALYSSGVDSNGNYFEIQNSRLRVWSSVDGTKLTDVVLNGINWNGYSALTGKESVARSGRELVIVPTTSTTSNAVVANVARFSVTGTALWNRDVVFPGYGGNESIALAAADSDGVYIIRSTAGSNGIDSQIAKLSSTGAVLWQRHYANARRVLETTSGLVALRSDVNIGNNSSDSFIFPVAAADGALGSPTIYSRSDVFAPTDWFAVNGGVVATFQGNNPFPPYTGYPVALSASSIFIGAAVANRWVVVADIRPAVSISQTDCLMPRVGKSGPSSWWARTQLTPQNSTSDWSTINSTSGVVDARTAVSAYGCGAPLTADGGQIVVSQNYDRIKKVSASGAPVWQTTSSSFPASYGTQPLQSIAVNGDITYAAGSLLGRATAAGSIVFETETNRANPRYLAVDSTNSAWVVASSGGADGYVTRVTSGGVLQWSVAVDAPSCTDNVMAAQLTASDELLVATQSCGEGRLFKITGGGQIAWQRVVSGTSLRPYVQLGALNVDSSGNIYAGGCASNGSPTTIGANAVSLLASWAANGSERWTAQSDLIGGASECVTTISTDSSNNVYAASSSGVASRAPVLWVFTSTGAERWRHSGVLSTPYAAATELTVDGAGKLIALGEAAPGATGSREATLRRINVASLGSAFKLKFLEVPATLVGYREQFSVRIGLRTAADVASNASSDLVVNIGLQSGTGTIDGSLTCTIVVGASECTISDTRYDVIEAGVTLTAGADGFATVISSGIGFRQAASTTTISAVPAPPYNAFSVIRVRAQVQGPPPLTSGQSGSLNGPNSPTYQYIGNCAYNVSVVGSLLANECDLLVLTAAMPLNAQFSSYYNTYASSTATPTSLPVTKVAATLQVSADPANTYIVGDRVRFRVAVLAPNGFNATPFIAANALTVTGGTCGSLVSAGNLSNQYLGSYLVCESTNPAVGPLNVAISFSGSDDLLAAGPSSQSVTINPGAILRGSGSYIPGGVNACSTTPGVTCGFIGASNYDWQCVGPVGMSGQVFFVPTPGSGSMYFTPSPVSFSNVNGLVTYSGNISYSYGSSGCSLDVDGDGARLAHTDGVLILRRMLGLSGDALIDGATHACVPRSAAGIAQSITLANYDIDGDGQTRAETDGLLLLRAMLGFRGNALIAGAIGVNATRRTVFDIQNYFSYNCGFYLN